MGKSTLIKWINDHNAAQLQISTIPQNFENEKIHAVVLQICALAHGRARTGQMSLRRRQPLSNCQSRQFNGTWSGEHLCNSLRYMLSNPRTNPYDQIG